MEREIIGYAVADVHSIQDSVAQQYELSHCPLQVFNQHFDRYNDSAGLVHQNHTENYFDKHHQLI